MGRCKNYFSVNSLQLVQPTDACNDHATWLETEVRSVCCTTIDCAKTRIPKMELSALRACLEKETRSTLKKMIQTRIKRLERKWEILDR